MSKTIESYKRNKTIFKLISWDALNIILNFEKADSNSILEFNNKIKKIYSTFNNNLDLDLIFPDLKIKCNLIKEEDKYQCIVSIQNHNGTIPDLSIYEELFESDVYSKFLNDVKLFMRNPKIIILDKNHHLVIDCLSEFIFLFFKTTRNSFFL